LSGRLAGKHAIVTGAGDKAFSTGIDRMEQMGGDTDDGGVRRVVGVPHDEVVARVGQRRLRARNCEIIRPERDPLRVQERPDTRFQRCDRAPCRAHAEPDRNGGTVFDALRLSERRLGAWRNKIVAAGMDVLFF